MVPASSADFTSITPPVITSAPTDVDSLIELATGENLESHRSLALQGTSQLSDQFSQSMDLIQQTGEENICNIETTQSEIYTSLETDLTNNTSSVADAYSENATQLSSTVDQIQSETITQEETANADIEAQQAEGAAMMEAYLTAQQDTIQSLQVGWQSSWQETVLAYAARIQSYTQELFLEVEGWEEEQDREQKSQGNFSNRMSDGNRGSAEGVERSKNEAKSKRFKQPYI